MTKLSLLPQETSISLADFLVKVKSGGSGDVIVSLQNILNAMFNVQTYTPTINSSSGGTWSSPAGYYLTLGTMKLCWGNVAMAATAGNGHVSLSAPPSFFSTIQIFEPAIMNEGGAAFQTASGDTATTTTIPFYVNNTGNGNSCTACWFIIGT